MKNLDREKVLYAVLNWGIGHATRSIELINNLRFKYDVVIASSGRSLQLLRDEFPQLTFIELPDYNVRYSKHSSFFPLLFILQIPHILLQVLKERTAVSEVIKNQKIDAVISDSRYGVFSKSIPSFFITHQLRIKFPYPLEKFEFLSEWFNRFFFRYYSKIIVLDSKDYPNFSGDLSHKGQTVNNKKVVYIGIVSSTKKLNLSETIDVLFSISGPEPQRTYFEKIVLEQIKEINGKKVVVLGKPDEPYLYRKYNDLEIYSYATREMMTKFINQAKLIVSRSGYSTVMEIVALNKKALFIPTPGQTEQEYIATILKKNELFHVARQKGLVLKKEIEVAKNFNTALLPHIDVNNTQKFIEIIESCWSTL
jgi:uncharacterized protein (TIGR00661 family)